MRRYHLDMRTKFAISVNFFPSGLSSNGTVCGKFYMMGLKYSMKYIEMRNQNHQAATNMYISKNLKIKNQNYLAVSKSYISKILKMKNQT